MACELESKPTFYEHTLASSAPNARNAAPAGAHSPIQKKIYRYSPFAPKITCSGLFGPDHHNLIDAAIKIPDEGSRHQVTAAFFMSENTDSYMYPIQRINEAVISSLTIEINGGEPVSFNAEFIGTSWQNTPPSGVDASGVLHTPCGKPLTWDRCKVLTSLASSGTDAEVQNFSVNIRNNPQVVYTGFTKAWADAGPAPIPGSGAPTVSGANKYGILSPGTGTNGNAIPDIGLTPRAIRPGMQEVTGTIGVFAYNAFNQRFGSAETITFSLQNPTDNAIKAYKLGVTYAQPSNHGSGAGIFVQNVSFTGVANSSTDGTWVALP